MATTEPKKTSTAVAAAVTGSMLILTFANNEILTVDADALSPEIRLQATLHGLKQKLIDAAAIARDPETGRTATITDKYNAVREVFDRITAASGATWNKVRAAGESGGNAKGGVFLTAMMRLTSKSRDEMTAWLDTRSKEELAALRKNPRIVDLMRLIQAERTDTSAVDTDALLDGLMDGGEADDGEADDDGLEAEAEETNEAA